VTVVAADEHVDARTTGSRPRVPTPPAPPSCASGQTLCSGSCCPSGQSCCNGTCCNGTCSNNICCAHGRAYCAGGCCEAGLVCCGAICCHDLDHCSPQGNHCCPADTEVCGEDCCGEGQTCCHGECCNGICYDEDRCCTSDRVFCEPTGECCAPGQQCCGAAGCCSGVCVGGGQVCCPAGTGEVCADACCDTATQECCTQADSSLNCITRGDCCPGPGGCCVNNTVGEVCAGDCCDLTTEACCTQSDGSLTCIPQGDCCPGLGGCCVNNEVGDVCGAFCCDIDTQDCCEGTDGTLSCIPQGDCCPGADGCCVSNAIGEVCGEFCCDPETQDCCEGIDGTLTCIDEGACCPGEGGCCVNTDCNGEEECAGTCNTATNSCVYPGSDTSCGDPTCSPGNEAVLTFACDGEGACETVSEDCSPYFCANAECEDSCDEGTDCLAGVCNADNTCCPPEDSCFASTGSEVCCPDDPENPGIGCCPAGDGCCECFVGSATGGTEPFCCEAPTFEVCRSADGDFTRDTCINLARYRCVNNQVVIREYVCDNNVVCGTPCCGGAGSTQGPGGTCCPAGTECSAGTCRAVDRPCTTLSDGSTSGCESGEVCTAHVACDENNENCGPSPTGTCCPAHRWYENPFTPDELGRIIECCPADEAAGEGCGGFQPVCHAVPDVHCTSRYSFGR
jgi:hypothetical protein